LIEGNRRFTAGAMEGHGRDARRRSETVSGQSPFAVVLTCSDSRVVPEIVFDAGIGDIFVLRVAGNVVDDLVLGSIEYAVSHLGVSLVMVLGHNDCGAVNAAIEAGEASGHTGTFIEAIRPAVREAEKSGGDVRMNSVMANVRLTAERLESSGPVLDGLVSEGKIEIVQALYDLESGEVEMLE